MLNGLQKAFENHAKHIVMGALPSTYVIKKDSNEDTVEVSMYGVIPHHADNVQLQHHCIL